MLDDKALFDGSDYSRFLYRVRMDGDVHVLEDVKQMEWQTIVLDCLLRCVDDSRSVNVNNIYDKFIDTVGFLDIRIQDSGDDVELDLNLPGQYWNKEDLISNISEYLNYLESMDFIRIDSRGELKSTGYNITLLKLFYETYNNNNFINLRDVYLNDISRLSYDRWEYLKSKNNVETKHISITQAVINRLRDLSKYFKSDRMLLTNRDEMSSYIFSEWIIYSLQVHQFVELLFNNLGYSTEFNDMFDVFDYIELDGQSDSNYMRYIRSLAEIHPDMTDRHGYINGFHEDGVREHSPYMDPFNLVLSLFMKLDQPNPSELFKYINPDMNKYNREDSYYISIYSTNKDETSANSDLRSLIGISPIEVKEFVENSYNQLGHLNDLLVRDSKL